MRLFRGLALLVVLLMASTVWAAEIARWEAGKPGKAGEMTLVNAAGSRWTLTQQQKFTVAAIEPTHDFYRRAEFLAKLSKPASFPIWLDVEYLDEGYGLISVGPAGRKGLRYIPWSHQWGVARLNTGPAAARHFSHRWPSCASPPASSDGSVDFHIIGAEYLHAIMVDDTQPTIEPVPEVKPGVQFADDFQRDINIGADSKPGEEAEALAAVRNMGPLAHALGFNAVESYVQWNYVEAQRGVYDWSHYDKIVNEIQKQGLKWFPLLIVGSAYSLPEWFHDSQGERGL